MLYFNDSLDKISDAEIDEIITTLPQQRKEQASKFKFASGRKECVVAYQLLCEALKKEYGIIEQPIFEYGEHGKPSIRGHKDIHFNFSHCKKAVMCYVNNSPVGIDCESLGRGNEGLIEYTMNDEEIQQINSAENPLNEFIKLWTKKEAVLKLTGEGINDDMKLVLRPENIKNIEIKTFVNEDKGYAYSIAEYK